MMKKTSLLLEIFSEEIPHLEVPRAIESLATRLKEALKKQEIPFETITQFSTHKRLALLVSNVPTLLKATRTLLKGPPLKMSYKNGVPTKAFEGWAKQIKQKIPNEVTFLQKEEEKSGIYLQKEQKGDCLVYLKITPEEKTLRLLSVLLVEVIKKLTFPKVMHWGEREGPFIRPVHSFCALLGEEVIPFKLWGVSSSNFTFGHAQLSPHKIVLNHAKDYEEKLRHHRVIVKAEERKKFIKEQIKEICSLKAVNLLLEEKVISFVNYLTEYPHLILAEFNEEFLELPRELIISELIEHQKYFPVEKDQQLTHFFVITSDILDEKEVKRGNQRVLKARLSDGSFLYQMDLKLGLKGMHAKLAKVIFQEKLGSYQDKVDRISRLATLLNDKIAFDLSPQLIQEGANLIKSDLTSYLVDEFPHLQGIIGYYYAKHEKRDEAVAMAIKEHYFPISGWSALPQHRLGLLLSLTDKIDTILGLFAVGLRPTASQDRYALKRQGFAVIRMLIEKRINLDLFDFFTHQANEYAQFLPSVGEKIPWLKSIKGFFLSRFNNYAKEKGIDLENCQAIEVKDELNPYLWWEKLTGLMQFKGSPGYDKLLNLFKRVENIIGFNGSFDEITIKQAYFKNEEEKKLWVFKKDLDFKINKEERAEEKNFFHQNLVLLSGYEVFLNDFFSKVLVHHEDEAIKLNRLRLLKSVYQQIRGVINLNALSHKEVTV